MDISSSQEMSSDGSTRKDSKTWSTLMPSAFGPHQVCCRILELNIGKKTAIFLGTLIPKVLPFL